MKFLKKIASKEEVVQMEYNILYSITNGGGVMIKNRKDPKLTRWYNGDTLIKELDVVGELDNSFIETQCTKCEIGENVTSIGFSAFQPCPYLTSVTIPDSVTSIGWVAFSSCRSFTSIGEKGSGASVEIPNSVTSIGERAFLNCSGLTSVTIPNSVTSIDYQAFWNCTNLTSVTIPNSVTSIGNEAFGGCYFTKSNFINNSSLTSSTNWGAMVYDEETEDGLLLNGTIAAKCRLFATSVTIPDGITRIDGNAFSGCTYLTSVTMTDSVETIGPKAFYGCSNLSTPVVMSKNLNNVPSNTFYNCSKLPSVTIPDNIGTVGDNAFAYCSNLTSITYRGITYTSKSELTNALTSNGTTVKTTAFLATALTA